MTYDDAPSPDDDSSWKRHHLAYFDEHAHRTVGELGDLGFEVAMHAALPNGIELYMVDTSSLLGHMTELYLPSPTLTDIYAFVRDQSLRFDGVDPVRSLTL